MCKDTVFLLNIVKTEGKYLGLGDFLGVRSEELGVRS